MSPAAHGRARTVAMLAVFAAATAAAGAFGARFTPGAWYDGLAKPSWNPPAAVFAPVWTVLYVTIAVSGWLVWLRLRRFSRPLLYWCIQLVLNAIWSWLFFGLHSPGLAAVEILMLLAAVLVTAVAFFRVDRTAAVLLVPYAGWVAFAAALNIALWRLNI